MKTVTSKKTVQTETQLMVEKLVNENINGLTIEILKTMSLQDLKTLVDNLNLVKKTDGKKAKTNIAIEVLNYCLKNDITVMTKTDLHLLILISY